MGFDKHFYEDHCYFDDPADGVGLNVEIIGENDQGTQNVVIEKPTIRLSESSNNKISDSVIYEYTNKFSKRALVYLPYTEYCIDHTDMLHHEDEKLVKPGDKFPTHDDFVQYLNENAKRWCFYYRCTDSRKPNTEHETYTYNCVYLRNKEKYKKKGLRKRNNNMKTDCPCKIKLRHLPNERELTVVYVCNHHDHELSSEEFYKLQHGRRIPPHVKEEVMDFLTLKVDIMKIRAYVEMETGFNMSRPFFYALEKNLKSRNTSPRQITKERLIWLRQKIAAVDEMYGYDEEENIDEHQILVSNNGDSETSKRNQHRKSIKNTKQTRKSPPLKKRSKANDEVTSSNTKRIKLEHCENSYNSETLQSVKNLQESVKCEIQTNPWVSDQCVLLNRITEKTDCAESSHVQTVEQSQDAAHFNAQNEIEHFSYVIEYFNPDQNNTHEIISNELVEIINDEGNVSEDNGIDNIAYETVVSDLNEDIQNEEQNVNDDRIVEDGIETNIENPQRYVIDQSTNIIDDNNTQDNESHIEYITEDNDDVVEYIDAINEVNSAQDVGVQTANNINSTHSLVPVFDVYMKDGNVTGFVVNDNLISGLKDGVDKAIQTNEDLSISNSNDLENNDFDAEIIHDIDTNGDTYTKHEYVHKYNIDEYMVQPHFPKYVKTLAKETNMDILHMFTNIYKEKAMFKITTTQKGKEGNTKIWYIKDISRLKRQRKDKANREKVGQDLQNAFLLKEKIRTLKKQNSQLALKNKQLEEVALRLVKLT